MGPRATCVSLLCFGGEVNMYDNGVYNVVMISRDLPQSNGRGESVFYDFLMGWYVGDR